jgi:hypothetical protein
MTFKSLSQKHRFRLGCLGTSAASPQFLRLWGRLEADRQAPEFSSGIGSKNTRREAQASGFPGNSLPLPHSRNCRIIPLGNVLH